MKLENGEKSLLERDVRKHNTLQSGILLTAFY